MNFRPPKPRWNVGHLDFYMGRHVPPVLLEVYLDDRWIFTLALADEARVGDIELFVERGEVEFSNVRLANIQPLE